jgi:hypothetical protein
LSSIAVEQLQIAPLGAGDLIDRTVRLYRRHFMALIRATAPPVIIGAAGAVMWSIGVRSIALTESEGRLVFYVLLALAGIFVRFVGLLAQLIVLGGASRNLVMHLLWGEPVTARLIYRSVRSRFWGLLGASLAMCGYLLVTAGLSVFIWYVAIFLFFVTVAVAYGVTVGRITKPGDVPNLMGEAVKDMSGFIVLIFAAAQFIAYFEYSNLGTWLAVNGAEFLRGANLTGLPTLIGFILITTALSFIIISGSALWAVLAPVFIPLFFLLDYNPAYVQAAYRIADSSTNVLTPLNPYVPLVLGFLRVYDKNAGFGTLFSLMLPYTALFLIVWTVLFIIWSLIGLPVGPGETLYVNW